MNKKKIVIHGCTGLKNSGDEAILQTIAEQLGKEYEITAISKDADYSRKMHPGIRVIPDEKKICRDAIDQCHLFVLGGGGLLQDETTIFNVAVWLRYLRYARRREKKICIYANSIGPVHSRWNRALIRKHLQGVDLITLRDENSAKLLEEIGIGGKEKVYVTADPVFSMSWEREDRGQPGQRAGRGEEYVCMALRHWFDMVPFIPARICSKYDIRKPGDRRRYQAYVQAMAECTEYINRELGCGVHFLSFYYGRDEKVARDVMARVKPVNGIKNKLTAGEYLTPGEVMNEIAGARFLVGMRLHSIIYAIKAGVPSVIIDYSSKVGGMARLNGLSAYSVRISELSADKLKEKIGLLLQDEAVLRKQLAGQQHMMEQREKENKRLVDKLQEDCGPQ